MCLTHQLALMQVKGVGNALAKHLLDHCGNAEEVFRTSKQQLVKIPGIGEYVANNIVAGKALQAIDKELTFIEKHKIKVLFWQDKDYPIKLKHCIDAPVLLYYKGNANLQTQKIISVVGTRNATAYGKRICDEFIEELKYSGALIVSGLAYGIDSYVHKACVKAGLATVGVLGHGLDRIYPSANRELALEMLKHGGLLTEYASGTNPDRQNFPSRNRIIAGLADVTVVVEAALKGGALITAEIANTYNRDVCAFPGDIYKDTSSGCNYLIKTHRAHLIHSAKDLAYVMGWVFENKVKDEKPLPTAIGLSPIEETVCRIVQQEGPLSIDELAYKANIPPSKLAIALLELEMKNVLIALPGKVYRVP